MFVIIFSVGILINILCIYFGGNKRFLLMLWKRFYIEKVFIIKKIINQLIFGDYFHAPLYASLFLPLNKKVFVTYL